MRIDILPDITPSVQPAGSAKPESAQSSGGSTFSAVMDQITAPEAKDDRAGPADSAPGAEKKDAQADDAVAVAPILPFAPMPSQVQPPSAPEAIPVVQESSCAPMPDTASVCKDGSNPAAPAAQAGLTPSPNPVTMDAVNITEACTPIPNRGTPAMEIDSVPAPLPKQGTAPAPAAAVEPEPPAPHTPPAEMGFARVPSATSPASAGSDLAEKDSRVQVSKVPMSPPTVRQADRGPSIEIALEMYPSTVEAKPQAEAAPAVEGAVIVEAVPAEPVASPSAPPSATGECSLEADLQGDSAPGRTVPDEPAAPRRTTSEAAADAVRSTAKQTPGPVVQVQSTGTPWTSEPVNHRASGKETQATMRRAQTAGQTTAAPTAPQSEAGRDAAPDRLAPADTISELVQPREGSGQTSADSKPAAEETRRDAHARPVDTTAKPVEPAWESAQNVPRLVFHSQPAPASASGTPTLLGYRPLSQGASTAPASWEAGFHMLQNAGGTEVKSILGLIAPKQSAPSQATDFLSQLAGRMQLLLRDNQNILTIQLKPSSLGRMEIRAESSSAGVTATIFTESAGVKDYLERNLPLLQQSFQDQGLKIERINVALQEGSWQHQSSFGHPESRSHHSQHGDSAFSSASGGDFVEPAGELQLDQQTLLALRPHSTFHTIA